MQENILIFHQSGFSYGSTEKLLRQMAKILSVKFKVFFAFSGEANLWESRSMQELGVTLVRFDYQRRKEYEPFTLLKMQPDINQIIKTYNIHCIFTNVFAHYQFPINSIPASIPLILISPFGHYATNGNVYKTYVSGKENAERIKRRGVKNVELFFNPLNDFPPAILNKPPVGGQIIFGRIGRSDKAIFDPIALRAFQKLEKLYPGQAKYIVVDAPPAWKDMAGELAIKNMEFRSAITEPAKLAEFYFEIDVLAHARKDGETVGMAIAEAMLAGNPILTHRSHFHNDHFDILDPSYAKWSEADDVEGYFRNMEWMLKNKNQIRVMGQLARQKSVSIFAAATKAPRIVADFEQACQHYYHHAFFGRIKGYAVLYWQNLKAVPFYAAKVLIYKFPKVQKFLRKFHSA